MFFVIKYDKPDTNGNSRLAITGFKRGQSSLVPMNKEDWREKTIRGTFYKSSSTLKIQMQEHEVIPWLKKRFTEFEYSFL